MICLSVLRLPEVYIQIAKIIKMQENHQWVLSSHSTTESLLQVPTCKATSSTMWAAYSGFHHPNNQEKRWRKLPHAAFLNLLPFTVSIRYSDLLVPIGLLSPFLMCFGLPGTGISFRQQQKLMRQSLGFFETCNIFWYGYTPGWCLSGIKVANAYALTGSGWHGGVPQTHFHGAFCHHTDSCGKTSSYLLFSMRVAPAHQHSWHKAWSAQFHPHCSTRTAVWMVVCSLQERCAAEQGFKAALVTVRPLF